MNSLERIQGDLEGKNRDRVPNCPRNFMLAAREVGIRMEEYPVGTQAIARAHLAALQKDDLDCIMTDTDTARMADLYEQSRAGSGFGYPPRQDPFGCNLKSLGSER